MRLILAFFVALFALSLSVTSCTNAIGQERPQPPHGADEIDIPGGHDQGGGATQ